jgi:hypothetical protein
MKKKTHVVRRRNKTPEGGNGGRFGKNFRVDVLGGFDYTLNSDLFVPRENN